MPHEFRGSTTSTGGRFGIVVSRYNDSITGNLLRGAIETLTSRGVAAADIDVVWVPGGWELPLAAKQLADPQRYAALICLGAVIRGETTHDQHINRQVSLSLGELSLSRNIPIAFGLLTTNSLEQAINRAGGSHGNKGEECALAALEMADLLRQIG